MDIYVPVRRLCRQICKRRLIPSVDIQATLKNIVFCRTEQPVDLSTPPSSTLRLALHLHRNAPNICEDKNVRKAISVCCNVTKTETLNPGCIHNIKTVFVKNHRYRFLLFWLSCSAKSKSNFVGYHCYKFAVGRLTPLGLYGVTEIR